MFLDCGGIKDDESVPKRFAKRFAEVRRLFLGAAHSNGHRNVLVCGLPNVGKSSVVLCVTKGSVQATRKKTNYHLATISSIAGSSVVLKKHRLDLNANSPHLMWDTPGILPHRGDVNADDLLMLAAAGHVTQSAFGRNGCKVRTWPIPEISNIVLQGLNRHWHLGTEEEKQDEPLPPYVGVLKLPEMTDDYEVLLDAMHHHVLARNCSGQRVESFNWLLKLARQGHLGGFILDDRLERQCTGAEETPAPKTPFRRCIL
ncbi:hypothetical protein M885DRAFT_10719 [Pelagophyceae sp. CCMP2097]|nr:hypothetical protein M885DRAFT_10719 [Pelagophyceae sp. CCMP2097]